MKYDTDYFMDMAYQPKTAEELEKEMRVIMEDLADVRDALYQAENDADFDKMDVLEEEIQHLGRLAGDIVVDTIFVRDNVMSIDDLIAQGYVRKGGEE